MVKVTYEDTPETKGTSREERMAKRGNNPDIDPNAPVPNMSAPSDGSKVELKFVHQPAVTMLDGQIPMPMMDELNSYIDQEREKMADYSGNLVGQIKQNERSQQLKMNLEHDTPKGLANLLASCGRSFLQSYSSQLQLSTEDGSNTFANANIDCFSMWTVHSYEGDYNPLHDHDVGYDQKTMSFTAILYCKVPPQIASLGDSTQMHSNGGATDGCTQFVWGTNTASEYLSLKPRQERFIVPKVGKFTIFPCWLKHSVAPFYGEGERRTLSANFRVPFQTVSKGDNTIQ